jgi:hypothetical protein
VLTGETVKREGKHCIGCTGVQEMLTQVHPHRGYDADRNDGRWVVGVYTVIALRFHGCWSTALGVRIS